MKKALVLVAAMAVVMWVAMPAMAVDLPVGDKLVKIADHSNLYVGTSDTPQALGAPIALGDEQHTLFQATTIFQTDTSGAVLFDTSSSSQLSGLLYDLRVLGVTVVGGRTIIDFGINATYAARNPLIGDVDGDTVGALDPTDGHAITFGGVLEVYDQAKAGGTAYTPDPNGVGRYDAKLPAPIPVAADAGNGPASWLRGDTDGSGHLSGAAPTAADGDFGLADAFPKASDGTLFLSAVLVELQYLANIGIVTDPTLFGDPAFAAGTVLREDITFTAGSGSGFAYANVVGGSFESKVGRGIPNPNGPGFPTGLADLAILFDINTPRLTFPLGVPTDVDTLVYSGPGQWQIDSQDPIVFTVVPEPATLSILGLGLAGLLTYRRRK